MTLKIKWKPLLFWIGGTLLVGALSSLVGGTSKGFEGVNTPSIVPPPIVFVIVWTILYILMGLSAYLVYDAKSTASRNAIVIYFAQLAVNFLWPVFFFRFHMFLFAFIWLLILLALVIVMTVSFYRIRKLAGYLQIPYILWLIFAGVINFMVYTMN